MVKPYLSENLRLSLNISAIFCSSELTLPMAHSSDYRLLLFVFAAAFLLLQYFFWIHPTKIRNVTVKNSAFIDNAKGFFDYSAENDSRRSPNDWENARRRLDEYKRGVAAKPSMKEFVRLLKKQTECSDLVQFGDDYGRHFICSPSVIVRKPRCVIYSIGVSGEIPFESAFQKYANNKCQVVLIDKHKSKQDFSSLNGHFMHLESVGTHQKDVSKWKIPFSETLRQNNHFSVSILKLNISEASEGLGHEIEILESTLLDFDVLHVVMTLNTAPVYMAGVLHTFENMGYALYAFEADSKKNNTLITSHFMIRDLRLHGFSKFAGKYYTPNESLE
ncbi:hypothetical protein QR680_017692 [Steinernema hermaphroditum]|uniref:Methyltransferase domain-containing protein n=1 Tax=Steinernema hermaphroditum TaxID=289476 RepID=A0AA39HHJ0_9BILA|nr:hypothetical protein QR680_017692 [Steinernema hermaphroditum]